MYMFRPLRRVQHALDDESARHLLSIVRRGVLAVTNNEQWPYAVPINFFYDEKENRILFHGSPSGQKADAIRKDNRVCFTVYQEERIDPLEPWAPYVRSAVVFGRCSEITDPDEKLRTLRLFAGKYYPDKDSVEEEIKRSGKAVRMYEIRIEHLCGKEIQEK